MPLKHIPLFALCLFLLSSCSNTPTAEEEALMENIITHSIEVTSPNNRSVHGHHTDKRITFTGEVSEGAERIVVTASFDKTEIDMGITTTYTSTPTEDVYELTAFEPGDSTFIYRADMDYNNLGLGLNHYLFTAYFEDGSEASTELELCYQFEIFYPASCWQE